MNKRINLLTFALAVVALLPLCSFASDLKPLYSARAKVTGAIGDTEALCAADSVGRFVLNPIQLDCEAPVPAYGKSRQAYVVKQGFEFKGSLSPKEDYKIVEDICKSRNIGIDGLFMRHGVRYNL